VTNRNNDPSARFRQKKKERSQNLEQTITELSGRVDDLEKEAEGLRRENTWLKEIVILKSRAQSGEGSSVRPDVTVPEVMEQVQDGTEERGKDQSGKKKKRD
jgi:hypothetical protein